MKFLMTASPDIYAEALGLADQLIDVRRSVLVVLNKKDRGVLLRQRAAFLGLAAYDPGLLNLTFTDTFGTWYIGETAESIEDGGQIYEEVSVCPFKDKAQVNPTRYEVSVRGLSWRGTDETIGTDFFTFPLPWDVLEKT